MNDFKIELHLKEVNNSIQNEIWNALEEASGELEAQTKRNTKVKTGRTKGSWTHKVDKVNDIAYVGSNFENAIWEEFGTGIYALEGNGRKTPWTYTPDGGITFYRTKGKKPRRALYTAVRTLKPRIQSYFEERFKNLK